MEYGIDAIFCMDILISFRTTYLNVKSGKEVIDSNKIARNYVVTGSFFIDLISTVPIDEIIQVTIKVNVKQIGLLGLIKTTRMLRLKKIITLLNI